MEDEGGTLRGRPTLTASHRGGCASGELLPSDSGPHSGSSPPPATCPRPEWELSTYLLTASGGEFEWLEFIAYWQGPGSVRTGKLREVTRLPKIGEVAGGGGWIQNRVSLSLTVSYLKQLLNLCLSFFNFKKRNDDGGKLGGGGIK